MDTRISKTNYQLWAVLGSRVCREKRNPSCHKCATFEVSIFIFSWSKNFLKLFWKYFSILTKKLHSIKTRWEKKVFTKYFSGCFWNRSVMRIGPESMKSGTRSRCQSHRILSKNFTKRFCLKKMDFCVHISYTLRKCIDEYSWGKFSCLF